MAKSIVFKEGWQAVSIKKIADAINYSLLVVYNHFESKNAILEEFVKHRFCMLADAIFTAKLKHVEASAQLMAIGSAYFNFAFEQRSYYQMMFGLGLPSCDRLNKIEEIGKFANLLLDSIRELGLPEITPEITRLKFHTLWAILHGLSSINMVNSTATPSEMQQLVLQDAIRGFINNIKN